MSVKDGLLALLASGSAHGYQLKGDFEEATGQVWSLNVGQVYTSLQRLERDGLVEPDPDASTDDDRRAFRLTATGREQLARWLVTPEPRTVAERDEVAMKILLARHTPGHRAAEVIAAQRTLTIATLQDLTRRKRQATGGTLADVVHLDRLILSCRAELDWLDLTEERLAQLPSRPDGNQRPSTDQRSSSTNNVQGQHDEDQHDNGATVRDDAVTAPGRDSR